MIEILNSPDIDFKKSKSIEEFKKSIEDISKVSKERFKLLSKYNLSVNLNLKGSEFAVAVASGAAVDFTSGIEIPLGKILLGLVSIVNIKLNKTVSLEKAKNNKELNYLSQANKNGLINI